VKKFVIFIFLFLISCAHQGFVDGGCRAPASNGVRCEDVFLADTVTVHELASMIEKGRPQEAVWLLKNLGHKAEAAHYEDYVLQAMKSAEIESVVPFVTEYSDGKKNLSETYIVHFKNGWKAVFKPSPEFWTDGKTISAQTANPKAEEMAYRFDRELELNMVPMTVIREINGMTGSLQIFVTMSEGKAPVELSQVIKRAQTRKLDADNSLLPIFDYLIYNCDRHFNNQGIWYADADQLSRLKGEEGVGNVAYDSGASFQDQNNAKGGFPPSIPKTFFNSSIESFMNKVTLNLTDEKIRAMMTGVFPEEVIVQTIRRRGSLLMRYQKFTEAAAKPF
jgi:hypothetical protein